MNWKRHGRKKPYTAIGIRRLPCFRCGKASRHVWEACADGNVQRPVCNACDVALNRLVLRFMGFPDWRERIVKYAATLT